VDVSQIVGNASAVKYYIIATIIFKY